MIYISPHFAPLPHCHKPPSSLLSFVPIFLPFKGKAKSLNDRTHKHKQYSLISFLQFSSNKTVYTPSPPPRPPHSPPLLRLRLRNSQPHHLYSPSPHRPISSPSSPNSSPQCPPIISPTPTPPPIQNTQPQPQPSSLHQQQQKSSSHIRQ